MCIRICACIHAHSSLHACVHAYTASIHPPIRAYTYITNARTCMHPHLVFSHPVGARGSPPDIYIHPSIRAYTYIMHARTFSHPVGACGSSPDGHEAGDSQADFGGVPRHPYPRHSGLQHRRRVHRLAEFCGQVFARRRSTVLLAPDHARGVGFLF